MHKTYENSVLIILPRCYATYEYKQFREIKLDFTSYLTKQTTYFGLKRLHFDVAKHSFQY